MTMGDAGLSQARSPTAWPAARLALLSGDCPIGPEYVARRSTAFHRGEQGIPVTCFFPLYCDKF